MNSYWTTNAELNSTGPLSLSEAIWGLPMQYVTTGPVPLESLRQPAIRRTVQAIEPVQLQYDRKITLEDDL